MDEQVQNHQSDTHLLGSRLAGFAAVLCTASLCGAAILATTPAAAAQPDYSGSFEQPYGYSYGEQDQPFDARTRDMNGNRVIVNGIIVRGDNLSTLPPGLYNSNGLDSGGTGFSGAGVATGNQLNVTTSGSYNTVIVNSTQVNNGNQTVNLNNGTAAKSAAPQALNGELDLNGY
jgi:holdfast attachment protein HfaA